MYPTNKCHFCNGKLKFAEFWHECINPKCKYKYTVWQNDNIVTFTIGPCLMEFHPKNYDCIKSYRVFVNNELLFESKEWVYITKDNAKELCDKYISLSLFK